MEGVGSLVHSTVQQFGDAKLLYAPSYFIQGSTQDVICLRGENGYVLCLQPNRYSLKIKTKYEKNFKAATAGDGLPSCSSWTE